MHLRSLGCVALAIAALLALPCAAHAYTITSFGPSLFTGTSAGNQTAMDAALGITGFTIEGFETGSTVGFTATGSPSPTVGASGGSQLWDGTHELHGGGANSTVTFTFSPSVYTVGFGLASFLYTADTVSVNGTQIATFAAAGFSNLTIRDSFLNGYLKIAAVGGDAAITSVTFGTGSQADDIIFDHIAMSTVSPVPEPLSAALALLGTGSLLARRAARRRPT